MYRSLPFTLTTVLRGLIRGPYIGLFLTDSASAAGTTDERNDLVIITLISGLVVCTWLDSYNKVQSALKQIT
jgi:hypothetical protein